MQTPGPGVMTDGLNTVYAVDVGTGLRRYLQTVAAVGSAETEAGARDRRGRVPRDGHLAGGVLAVLDVELVGGRPVRRSGLLPERG